MSDATYVRRCGSCGEVERDAHATECSKCLELLPAARPPRPLAAWRLTCARTGAVIALPQGRSILGRERFGAEVLEKIPQVSRQHCTVEVTGEGVWVSDVGSTHGTFVGPERRDCRAQPRQPIRDGDPLFLGREMFVLSGEVSPLPAPTELAPRSAAPWVPADPVTFRCLQCGECESPVREFTCRACGAFSG